MNGNIVIIASLLVLLLLLINPTRRYLQRRYIKNYSFPNSVKLKVSKHYPNLEKKQINFILEGLKQFFIINNRADKKNIAMPSQAVDVAWHEFILHTQAYEEFCKRSMGRFLHHTPAEAMKTPTIAKTGIKRAWSLSCKEEKIDPESPVRLPIIFEIDNSLEIPDGYKYSLNCSGSGAANTDNTFCSSHIGCISDGVEDGAGKLSDERWWFP
jgi:hypothetical protein